MIEINNLVKKYGDHTAVDHLSLVVEPGKIYGFLGPNGGRQINNDEYDNRISRWRQAERLKLTDMTF